MINWREFLSSWEREKNEIVSLVPLERAQLPANMEESKARLFFPPASAAQIARAEMRLGCVFPDDLRAFYLVSNGWSLVGMGDMALAPVENFIRISDLPPDYQRDVAEYFSIETENFVGREFREQVLFISNTAQTGFCVANPIDTETWEYACVEFGVRESKFNNFIDFMNSAKWFCLHYLRGNL